MTERDEAAVNREILSSPALGTLLAIRDHTERIERMMAGMMIGIVLVGVVWMVSRVSSQ